MNKNFLKTFLALNILILNADPGFVHIDNPMELTGFLNGGPDNVTNRELIKENVFRIIELSPQPVNVLEYKKVLEKFIEEAPAEKKEEANHSFVYKLAQEFISKCEIAQKEECILPELASGTAFFAQDPNDSQKTLLWTVRHNFVANVDYLKKSQRLMKDKTKNVYRSASLQFLLFNYKGQLVYNTLTKGSSAAMYYYWEPSLVESNLKGLSSMPQALDFMALQLEKTPSVRAFRFSANIPVESSYVYKAGFPSLADNRFPAYKKSNSDGKSLFLSTGWTTSPAHAMAYVMGDFHVGAWKEKAVFGHSSNEDWVKTGSEQNDLLKKYYLNFGTEGVGGFSGSPVFNSKGEVIAIFQGAMGVNLEEYYKDFSSIGLHSKWILELVNQAR